MTPAARLLASIELWDKITLASVPMDRICGDYFRNRRYVGSKDRAEIAERVYTMMRSYAKLGWWCAHIKLPASSRSLVLVHAVLSEGKTVDDLHRLCNDRQYHPDAMNTEEMTALTALEGQSIRHPDMPDHVACECPITAYERLHAVYGERVDMELQAMIPAATLDVRVNTIKSTVSDVLDSLRAQGVDAKPCPFSPVGLRLQSKAFLSKTKAFTKGLIEIQDEGSQLLALICNAKPGMQVIDYCAGGGGKTLALAASMQGKGRIVAMDLYGKRLAQAKKRLTRADVHNVELRPLDDDKHKKWFRRQKENFDLVLVDAPCTSSGTWRRNPDLRWNVYGPTAEKIQVSQYDILERVKTMVKKGGRIVYATCSLYRDENENQIEAFLQANPDYKLVPIQTIWHEMDIQVSCPVSGDYLRLSPAQHQTDGFFAAILERLEE